MKHVHYLDMYPDAHLITEAEPYPQKWNGWDVPSPTPRELIRYLDELRTHMGDDDWWDTLSAFMAAYGNDRHDEVWHDLDEPIGGYMGFTWQARPMFTEDNGYNRQLAQGHRMRMGHELVGYYVPAKNTIPEWNLMALVRLCCPDENVTPSGVISVSRAQFEEIVGE